MIEVVTNARCDACEMTTTQPGANGHVPPVGWYRMELTQRRHPAGWTNSATLQLDLCPECARKVGVAINGLEKWSVFKDLREGA